jgi:probable rRNA maturation factor
MGPLTIQADIAVENPLWENTLPEYKDLITRALEACRAAKSAELPEGRLAELSISLTDDNGIRTLNREYRNKDKATNVLSFPQIEDWGHGSPDLAAPCLLLGDIVVALETIQREAVEQDKTMQDHFIHMIIHSFLHLLGYDHEIEEEARIMEGLEIEILKSMSIKNPYQSL